MKKIFFVLIAAMMLPMTVSAQKDLIAEGTCGEGLNWELNDKGCLWIMGADVEMTSFPWAEKHLSDIESVIMLDGTTISANAFRGCVNLQTVSILADKLESVGAAAFGNCVSLDSIYIQADQVPTVASNAFVGMTLKPGKESGQVGSVDAKLFVPYPQMGKPVFDEGYQSSNWAQLTILPAGAAFIKKGVEKTAILGFDNLLYSFSEDGVLELWPNLKNEDVAYYGETELELEWPWESPFYMNEEITEVIVHEGVYGLGTGAFLGCSNLRKAVLQKVYVMGYSSDKNLGITFFPFAQCPKLELIEHYYPYTFDYPNGIMYDDLKSSVRVAATQYCIDQWKENDPYFLGSLHLVALPAKDKGELDNIKWSISYDHVLTILGKGDMPDFESFSETPWAKYEKEIEKIVVSEGITSIGAHAFEDCLSQNDYVLCEVYLPSTLTSLGTKAFGRSISEHGDTQFTCLAITVPEMSPECITVSEGRELYNIRVFVWSYMLFDYDDDPTWGNFFIQGLAATSIDVEKDDEVIAEEVDQNTICVTWPEVVGAVKYTITLESDKVIYTITVGDDGNVVDVSTSYKIPARDARKAEKTASGFQWWFSGIEPGEYKVTVVAVDDKDAVIGEPLVTTAKTMDEAETPTGLESIQNSDVRIQKMLLNGNLYILKGGQLYDAQGKMIKK